MSTGALALLCFALWRVAVLACLPPSSRLVLVGALVGGLSALLELSLVLPSLRCCLASCREDY